MTVGDFDGFADRGDIIGLAVTSGRVRFEVNIAAARQVRLTISSQLLKLASRVEERSP